MDTKLASRTHPAALLLLLVMHDQDFKSLHMEGPEMSESDLCSCSAGSTPIDHCASVVAAEPHLLPQARPPPEQPASSPASPAVSGRNPALSVPFNLQQRSITTDTVATTCSQFLCTSSAPVPKSTFIWALSEQRYDGSGTTRRGSLRYVYI